MSEKDPQLIYLQQEELSSDMGRCWCSERINDDDTKYIRMDLHDQKIQTQQKRIEELDGLLYNAYEGLQYAVMLINNYEIHRDGNRVLGSSTFDIIKTKYEQTKQALTKNKGKAND